MNNYEIIWQVSKFYIPMHVIILLSMALFIVIFCVLFPIVDYIRKVEERSQENMTSIIRWFVPAIILVLLCYGAIIDYKDINLAGRYYKGEYSIVEGKIREQCPSAHYTIIVDNKELHLIYGFAIEKLLPQQSDYVRISYVEEKDTYHIVKIEKKIA